LNKEEEVFVMAKRFEVQFGGRFFASVHAVSPETAIKAACRKVNRPYDPTLCTAHPVWRRCRVK